MIQGLYQPFQKWSENGAVYCTADLHLGESEALRYSDPKRPSDEDLIKQINKVAGRTSTLLVLGDIGIDLELIAKLRANIVLIRGNHDHLGEYYKDVVQEYYEGILTISPKIILSHEPISLPYAVNLHGHVHSGPHMYYGHCNVSIGAMNYSLLNLNQFVKSGKLKEAEDIHQETTKEATMRARKRGYRLKDKIKYV